MTNPESEPARVPETVIRSPNSNASGSPVLHIPHPDDDEDVYCSRLKSEAPKPKSIGCFPPAWRKWCEKCVENQREALALADGGGYECAFCGQSVVEILKEAEEYDRERNGPTPTDKLADYLEGDTCPNCGEETPDSGWCSYSCMKDDQIITDTQEY